MIFNFKNATPLEHLNSYKNNGNINQKLYEKALKHLNSGYSYQLCVNNITEQKVVKVLKGNKL